MNWLQIQELKSEWATRLNIDAVRAEKAATIVSNNLVSKLMSGDYQVVSESDPKKSYHVHLKVGANRCGCPDFDKRQINCKHILAATIYAHLPKESITTTDNLIDLISRLSKDSNPCN